MTDLPRWKRYFHEVIAAEISAMTRYFAKVIQWKRVDGDDGYFLDRVEAAVKSNAGNEFPDLSAAGDAVAALLYATFNHDCDVEELLHELYAKLPRSGRAIVVFFNPYLEWLYRWAAKAGLKAGGVPTTFLTFTDVDNLCRLTHFERVRTRRAVYVPWRLFGLGSLLNKVLPVVPLLRHLALTAIVVLRPVKASAPAETTTVSVIIPVRNERGNIEAALQRLPDLGATTEVVFVEGHSSDGTWDEIQRVADAYRHRFAIQALQQTGSGKADAVRIGFSHASGELLVILDGDLTVAPEMLPRFVNAFRSGAADVINGNRIAYPMEGAAMRFLNRLGNVFFAKAATWVLDVRLGDCLCGTKLVRRADYERMTAWRHDFGDVDPFGDFELLFPAAAIGIGVVDVPVRYRARTYGATNIRRFSDGFRLLAMTLAGTRRIKCGHLPPRS